MRRFERELLEQADWREVRAGLEVKLVAAADGNGTERYVLCRSTDRAAKERAMLDRQLVVVRSEWTKLGRRLRRAPEHDLEKVGRQIGRWLGRYPAAAKVLRAQLVRDAEQRACGLAIVEERERLEWAQHAHGAYLLRTNHAASEPAEFWRWYIQLTQAEAAFRVEKSDLGLRQAAHRLKTIMHQYTAPRLLVLDEVGYLPLGKQGADLLFQVISERYEHGSIVLTTNKAFKQWPAIFHNDSTLTSAVLDRLLHHAETVLIEGTSYRMKDQSEP